MLKYSANRETNKQKRRSIAAIISIRVSLKVLAQAYPVAENNQNSTKSINFLTSVIVQKLLFLNYGRKKLQFQLFAISNVISDLRLQLFRESISMSFKLFLSSNLKRLLKIIVLFCVQTKASIFSENGMDLYDYELGAPSKNRKQSLGGILLKRCC